MNNEPRIVGALMSRLPQLLPGQVPVPWYHDGFLLAGIALAFIGLLLLTIPLKHWRTLGRLISPCSIYRSRKERQKQHQREQEQQEQQEFLKSRLPTYVIHEPVIDARPINLKDNFPQYTGKFKIEITNQLDCIEPVEVYFNARIALKQKWGYGSLSMSFIMQPRLPNSTIPLKETREYEINMVGWPDGTGLPYLDLSQCYHWTIEGITLSVAGLQQKVECHSEGNSNG